ncbi:DUF6053 domain-containing protein [Lysobacter enzymogenes]|uniref:DUF6053 domain-containing protein n=1 Tax=Lysobacter enzymogenes TaxID=69 RepID=UPI003CCDB6E9
MAGPSGPMLLCRSAVIATESIGPEGPRPSASASVMRWLRRLDPQASAGPGRAPVAAIRFLPAPG